MVKNVAWERQRRPARAAAGVFCALLMSVAALSGCRWPAGLGPDFAILAPASAGSAYPARIRHEPSGITLRYVAAGSFLMGSPETEYHRQKNEAQRSVEIADGFYLAETETTVAQWRRVMQSPPPLEQPSDEHPVSGVSWHVTREFLARIGRLGAGSTGWSLPTEMQWEYACRAGTTTPFSFGDDITTDQVNYNGNHPYKGGAKQSLRGAPVAVRSLPANAWGFYEMHGNLWEWCEERYVAFPESGARADDTDPGAARPIRGGGFAAQGERSRCAYRDGYPPSSSGDKYGFRLAFNPA